MLTSANPGLSVVHVQTAEDLMAACLRPPPGGGERRLIAFSTSVIVPKAVLDGLTLNAYNFHPGPPTYPGSHAASFAIYEGAEHFGATAHVMEEKVDCGPIVGVEWFAMPDNPRFLDLEIKTYEVLLEMFARFSKHFATSDDPLAEIDAQWSGAKHTNAQFEAMKVLEADMEEAEINLRYRAFG
ncbi:MAG: methionyl-tRNA formyltransferase [Alphaproteobacteria bacterium]|nr:methionyl-tRNA formyltransferase [Alphaproteobacteria bacterium]